MRPGRTASVGVMSLLAASLVIASIPLGWPSRAQAASTPANGEVTVARLWLGLATGDAIGFDVDLFVKVFANGALVNWGRLDNVRTGSVGFGNAILHTIALGRDSVPDGSNLEIEVATRRTCSTAVRGSGTLRLWYNGQPVDKGPHRDAGSRVGATVDTVTDEYFLRERRALDAEAGSAKTFVDVFLDSTVSCPDRPFTSLGVWSVRLP